MEDDRGNTRQPGRELEEARLRIAALEEAMAAQKQVEDALREDEEKYQIHFLLADDVMFSYNDQLKVLSVSPNVERILGYPPGDFIGKSLYEAGVLAPGCMNLAVTNALKVLSGQAVFGSIYEFIARDGSIRFGEVSGVPVMRDGRVTKVVTVARDITERIGMENSLKSSEERYRTTLEGLPDAVGILTTGDCRYLYVNEGFSRMTGYWLGEAVGSSPIALNLAENENALEDFLALIRGAAPVERLECRCRRKDGVFFDAVVSARPVEYDGQSCMIVVMTDVTAAKRIEEEKKLMEIQSQKFESLGTLARGIAHDFNNILTTIIGYTRMTLKDILAKSAGDHDFASVRSDLEEVRMSALRARDIVDQILAFSRHTEKVHAPLDLSSVVEDSLKGLSPILPRAIELIQDTGVPGMIMGDPGQIHQVVMNLCTNAIHAMKDSRGRLEVSLAREDIDPTTCRSDLDLPQGPCLKLVVRDTGIGMTKRTLARIFDPYFTTRDKEHGTGLGLSVVHGIVKSHGGCIICSSEPGQGTTFEIYFPGCGPQAEGELFPTYVTRIPLPGSHSRAGEAGLGGPGYDEAPGTLERKD
jgi:two-component system, cell cycle sensor histidine kinase and response regulator CckA